MDLRIKELVQKMEMKLQMHKGNTASKSKSALFINKTNQVKREISKVVRPPVSTKYQKSNSNQIAQNLKDVLGDIKFPVIYCNKLPPNINNERPRRHHYSTGNYVPKTKPLKVNKVSWYSKYTIDQLKKLNLTKRELIRATRAAEVKFIDNYKKPKSKPKPRKSKTPRKINKTPRKINKTRVMRKSSSPMNVDPNNQYASHDLPDYSKLTRSTESKSTFNSFFKRNQHKFSQIAIPIPNHISTRKTTEDQIEEYYVTEIVEPAARSSTVMTQELTKKDFKKIDNRNLDDFSLDAPAVTEASHLFGKSVISDSELVTSSWVFNRSKDNKSPEQSHRDTDTLDHVKINLNQLIDGNLCKIENVKLPLKSVGSKSEEDCEFSSFDRSSSNSKSTDNIGFDPSSVEEIEPLVELTVSNVQYQKPCPLSIHKSNKDILKKSSDTLLMNKTTIDEYFDAHATSYDKGITMQPDSDRRSTNNYLFENDKKSLKDFNTTSGNLESKERSNLKSIKSETNEITKEKFKVTLNKRLQ